jgi:hypothetical protein
MTTRTKLVCHFEGGTEIRDTKKYQNNVLTKILVLQRNTEEVTGG